MPDSNTQALPGTPVSTGPTVEELQAQLEVTKKESEGRLRDLQGERAKRQELETKLPPPPAPSTAPKPDDKKDEVAELLNPYLAPIARQATEAAKFAQQYYQDKSLDFLAEKTGRTKEAILADKDYQDKLVATAHKWGFVGNIFTLTQRAYEAMELEGLKTKETERVRAATAAAGSGLPSGTPSAPAASSKEFSREDFLNMPPLDYEKLAQGGSFHENEAGKIVFTPKK